MKQTFTANEISIILEKARSTICEWLKAGDIKGIKTPGGLWQVTREDLIDFMNECGYPLDLLEGRSKKYVLIVDDEPDVLNIIEELFKDEKNFVLKFTEDPFEAGVLAREFLPHVMILDIKLQKMDGRNICHTMRRIPEFENTRLIAISGKISEREEKEILKYGFDKYFRKPFDIFTFKKAVEKLVYT